MSRIVRLGVVCVVLALSATVNAQEKPAATAVPATTGPLVGMKVQLVLSRHQGDKKISNMPYLLQLTANERGMTNLRMGTDVPVASGGGGYNYRSVGTNIDCRAETAGDGTYKLYVTVNDSSVRFPDRDKPEPGSPSSATAGLPAFRSFTANFVILLRDGQTAQYTSATDPASGEVLKVDATLTVLK